MKTVKSIIELFRDLEKKMSMDTQFKMSIIKNSNKFIS